LRCSPEAERALSQEGQIYAKITAITGGGSRMANITTLYHGTIYEFDIIDVTKGKWNKDFGRGFYTTRDIRHAERLAIRNKSIEEERFMLRGMKKSVTPWIYTFEFDLDNLVTLNVREFATADRAWMEFVVLNRESKTKSQEHSFDIVIGPTANDNTRAAIQTIMPLTKGQVMTDKAIDTLIALVEPDNLPWQFFFGTQCAVGLLRLTERKIIR
jgi:hypothetical protein